MKKDSFSVIFFSLIFMILFLSLGGGGIYYGINKYVRHTGLVSNGVKTVGKITEYNISWSESKDSKKRKTKTKMYSPIIKYFDNSGKSYELDSDYSSSSKEWCENVTIYYSKSHPSQAIRGGFWYLWFIPFLVLCSSMIPLGIGIYIFRYYINAYLKKIKYYFTNHMKHKDLLNSNYQSHISKKIDGDTTYLIDEKTGVLFSQSERGIITFKI